MSQQGEGFVVIQADQNQPEQLREALRHPPSPVRLVIDDGSHLPRHQLSSFSMIFEEVLEPGGFYIIEDIETSYWLSGDLYGNQIRAGLFSRWSAIESLKLAADYINRAYISEEDRNLLEYSMLIAGLTPTSAGMINTLTFGQNCVLLGKNEPGDSDYQERPYPYAQFTARS